MVAKAKTTKTKAPKASAKTMTMLIKEIDPKVWQAFKVRAATEGRQLKWLFHTFIENYAAGK